MMKTKNELLARAIELYNQGVAVPMGELGATASIAGRYKSARSRYAQSAGLSEVDAHFIIRNMATREF